MKKLFIEGVISNKTDAERIAGGQKVFGLSDLEDFLAANGSEPFEVVISSIGGSVEEGFAIYDRLKDLDVTTVALTANSIASVIFLAGKVRKVTPSSEIIIHNAWVDAEELSGEKLNFHTLKALTELFAATDMRILDVYTQAAGPGKASKLLALMAEETNLGAEMALALGFATEVVEMDYKALSFRNKVLTFSRNQIDLLGLQDGPITTYADVIYFNEAGEVLLLQRTEEDDFEPGRWGFPGGKVMQGETTAEGAARELEEETGVTAGDLLALVGEEVNEDESLTYYYTVSGTAEPSKLPEHKSWAFVAVEDFDNYSFIKDQTERFKNLVNLILDNSKMKTEETEKKLNAFEKALTGLKNLFKVTLKNMAVMTKDGVAIFIAGAEDGELVGKTVYLAEEGMPTEMLAPAGVHVLEDGTSVTIDDAGVITEVVAPEPAEDVEALKAAFEAEKMAMQEEKDKLEAKVAAQAKVIEDSKEKLAQLSKDFIEFKNQINGDPDDKKKKAAEPLSAEEFAKLSTGEKIRLRAMNKAEVGA